MKKKIEQAKTIYLFTRTKTANEENRTYVIGVFSKIKNIDCFVIAVIIAAATATVAAAADGGVLNVVVFLLCCCDPLFFGFLSHS